MKNWFLIPIFTFVLLAVLRAPNAMALTVSEDFQVTPDFKTRVEFWVDVYTKYSAQEEIIHHADYPWLVFRVVDLRPILSGPGHKWSKYHASVKHSKQQMAEVRSILKKLSLRKNYNHLSEEEKFVFNLVEKIPGKNRQKVFRTASLSLRRQVGQKDFVERGLKSSSLYMPELEKIFSSLNLPPELTRLPFVESSFNTDAVSKVGASGIWQIMPYIGRKFLVMNSVVDERNSPVKAAKTAAFILKQNKQILKTWPLALTAYNHGAGDLITAIRKTKSRDLGFLIQHYNSKSFGFASQNFYASFLAILHAEKNKDQFFDTTTMHPPLEFQELRLSRSVRINQLVELSDLGLEEFKLYNLDIKKEAYKRNMRLPKGYVVHLPQKSVDAFLRKDRKLAKLVSPISTSRSL